MRPYVTATAESESNSGTGQNICTPPSSHVKNIEGSSVGTAPSLNGHTNDPSISTPHRQHRQNSRVVRIPGLTLGHAKVLAARILSTHDYPDTITNGEDELTPSDLRGTKKDKRMTGQVRVGDMSEPARKKHHPDASVVSPSTSNHHERTGKHTSKHVAGNMARALLSLIQATGTEVAKVTTSTRDVVTSIITQAGGVPDVHSRNRRDVSPIMLEGYSPTLASLETVQRQMGDLRLQDMGGTHAATTHAWSPAYDSRKSPACSRILCYCGECPWVESQQQAQSQAQYHQDSIIRDGGDRRMSSEDSSEDFPDLDSMPFEESDGSSPSLVSEIPPTSSRGSPDSIAIEEFQSRTGDRFTLEEAEEVLEMCAGNMEVACAMYHNSRGAAHVRQMLEVWMGPSTGDNNTVPPYSTAATNVDNATPRRAAPLASETPLEGSVKSLINGGDDKTGITQGSKSPFEIEYASGLAMSLTEAMEMMWVSDISLLTPDALRDHYISSISGFTLLPLQHATDLAVAFKTIVAHLDGTDGWYKGITWTPEMDRDLLELRAQEPFGGWSCLADTLDMEIEECKKRFKAIKSTGQWPRCVTKITSTKTLKQTTNESATAEKNAVPIETANLKSNGWDCLANDVHQSTDGDWGDVGRTAHEQDASEVWDHSEQVHNYETDVRNDISSWTPPSESGFTPCPPANAFKVPYTVTYWATVESGDQTIHIPIDDHNISGPEKFIMNSDTGMKKVWKWVQEKGLGHNVGLLDVFELAKSMNQDESIGETHKKQAKHRGSM